MTISNGRGYWFKGERASYKSASEIIRILIETASMGGNFLLNVGPQPNGELPAEERLVLADVAAWMRVNGESIHGTRRGALQDLSWGYSTSRGDTLYLHVLEWPANGQLHLAGFGRSIQRAHALADSERTPLEVEQDGADWLIAVDSIAPDPSASVIVLQLGAEPSL